MFAALLLAPAHAGDALSEYASRRLVCWAETRYHSSTQISDDGSIETYGGDYRVWGVKDGRGQALDTVTFASMVGDEDYVAELEADADTARRRGRTLTLAGVGLAAVGGVGLFVGRTSETFPLMYGGSIVFAGGAALGGYGLTSGMAARAPLEDVSRAYEYGLAAQYCENHNETLRQELGLTRQDTQLIDTAWAPPLEARHPVVVRPTFGPGTLGVVGVF
jgi:hypothetical protein